MMPAWIERVRAAAPGEYQGLLDGVVMPDENPERVLPKVLAQWLRRLPQTAERDGVLALLDRSTAGEVVSTDEWNAAWAAAWGATGATGAAKAAALAAEAAASAAWAPELAAWSATWASRAAYWASVAGVSWADLIGDLRDELTGEVAE